MKAIVTQEVAKEATRKGAVDFMCEVLGYIVPVFNSANVDTAIYRAP